MEITLKSKFDVGDTAMVTGRFGESKVIISDVQWDSRSMEFMYTFEDWRNTKVREWYLDEI